MQFLTKNIVKPTLSSLIKMKKKMRWEAFIQPPFGYYKERGKQKPAKCFKRECSPQVNSLCGEIKVKEKNDNGKFVLN